MAHEHESNGGAGKRGQDLPKHFRVRLLALQRKIDARIPINHPSLSWLVEFVGDVASKYLVGVVRSFQDQSLISGLTSKAMAGISSERTIDAHLFANLIRNGRTSLSARLPQRTCARQGWTPRR